MQLLDLPPEVFQRVIAKYVAKVGLCEAWKHREVCKTFNAYITKEVFGRQPLKVYTRHTSKHLLKKGLALYLELRTTALYGAHDILPNRIRKIVDIFMKAKNHALEEKRAKLTRRVCEVFVKQSSKTYNLVAKPTIYAKIEFGKDTDLGLALCIAVILQDLEAITATLANGASMCECTKSFGIPLELATMARNEEIIHLLLQNYGSSDMAFSKEHRSKIVIEAAIHAIRNNAESLGLRLLNWHAENLGRPKDALCIRLFSATKYPRCNRIMNTLLGLGFSASLASHYRRNFLTDPGSGKTGPATLLRTLLKQGIFSTKQVYKYIPWFGAKGEPQSLLGWAVRREQVELARILLKAGANPNGLEIDGRLEYPLSYALEATQDNTNIVRLLLEHGADPEAGRSAIDVSTWFVVHWGSDTCNLVYKAINDKIANCETNTNH